MSHHIIDHGSSRSFPADHPFRTAATGDAAASVDVHLGRSGDVPVVPGKACVLIELDVECLGTHTGESDGSEGDVRIGFSRWVLGDEVASDLVELVVQPCTEPEALTVARELFQQHGFRVAVCADAPGRILNRLVRPYFNDALRALDEGVATAADLDKTVRLGLGYPEGPIALLRRSGLHEHHRVTTELHEQLGEPAFLPARRATVAADRHASA